MNEIFNVVGAAFLTLSFAWIAGMFKRFGLRRRALVMIIPAAAGCWWLITVSPWFWLLAAWSAKLALAKEPEWTEYLNIKAHLNNRGIAILWQIKAQGGDDDDGWERYHRIKRLEAALDKRVEKDRHGRIQWKSKREIDRLPADSDEERHANEIVEYYR